MMEKWLVKNLQIEDSSGNRENFHLVYLDAEKDDDGLYNVISIRDFHREEAGYTFIGNLTIRTRLNLF